MLRQISRFQKRPCTEWYRVFFLPFPGLCSFSQHLLVHFPAHSAPRLYTILLGSGPYGCATAEPPYHSYGISSSFFPSRTSFTALLCASQSEASSGYFLVCPVRIWSNSPRIFPSDSREHKNTCMGRLSSICIHVCSITLSPVKRILSYKNT